MAFKDIQGTIKSHGRDHRGVPNGLQVHVATTVGTFEFEYNEVGILVYAQEVDSSPAILPVAKLLGYHEGSRGDHIDLLF